MKRASVEGEDRMGGLCTLLGHSEEATSSQASTFLRQEKLGSREDTMLAPEVAQVPFLSYQISTEEHEASDGFSFRGGIRLAGLRCDAFRIGEVRLQAFRKVVVPHLHEARTFGVPAVFNMVFPCATPPSPACGWTRFRPPSREPRRRKW